MELRRLTAKKCFIKELVTGRFIQKEAPESSYVLTRLGRRLSRVRVLANVVDIYENPSSSFASITIDDSTGVIRAKIFGDTEVIRNIEKGDLIDVIGKLRNSEGETWINLEIVKRIENPNFEILRMLEVAKILKEQKEKFEKVKEQLPQSSDINELFVLLGEELTKKEIEAIVEASEVFMEMEADRHKALVLQLIEELDYGDGADYKELLERAGIEEKLFDQILQELLEKGYCFEPKPGKIKKVS